MAALWLAACTEVVDLTTESRYAQYNRTTDWAKNEAILLNIIRASENQPLNFLVYQAYTGTATASATAASPGFIIGPARTASQKQFTFSNSTLSVSGSGTGSISVQNLDTQDFYNALLSPVDFTNLYAFQRQGYPRELLFRLFTDYVSLKPPQSTDPQGRGAYIVYNEPGDKRCNRLTEEMIHRFYPKGPVSIEQTQVCFDDLVEFALLSGLTSEIRAVAAPSGSGGDNKQQAAAGSGTPPTGGSTNPSSTSTSNSQKPTTEGRLCFDGALANRALNDYAEAHRDDPKTVPFVKAVRMAEYHPVCGGTGPRDVWLTNSTKGGAAGGGNPSLKSNSSAGTNTISVDPKIPTGSLVWDIHLYSPHNVVEIGTRSTFSIYNFLGTLVKHQDEKINKLNEPDQGDDGHVLTVVGGGQTIGCFSSVAFELGFYCVPIDDATNTKRTFSILSQLLALKTTTGDLQLQPIFRLQPQ
jgi:hypothetical protein